MALLSGMPDALAQCPIVTNTTQTFCDIEAPTIANLVATPNGNGVAWYATAVSTTALSSALGLADGEDYFADDLSGTCGARTRVVVTVYGKPFAQSFQGPCVDNPNDATIADLTATGNNIQWYSAPTGGAPLSPTTILIDNAFYYASQTNPVTLCETSRRSVQVTVGVVPMPSGDPIQRFCNLPGSTLTLNDLVVSGDNNWYATASSAVELSLATPLVNGQSYYATTVDPPCESSTRFEVTVVLVPPNNAGTSGTRSICVNTLSTTPPFNLFSLLGGTPDTTGAWTGPLPTTNGSQGTVNVSTLTLAGSPYVFTYTSSSAALCPPATSTVSIIVLPLPTVAISASATTICSGSGATVTFTGTPNATVNYTVNGGGTQSVILNGAGTATIVNTYTANAIFSLVSATSAGTPSCVQAQTGSVTITVRQLPTVTISSNTTICPGSSATVTFTGTPNATVAYTVNGGGNQNIVLNGAGLATITNTYTTTTNFTLVSVTSSGVPACSQSQTGSMIITVRPLPAVTISGSTNICPNGSATVTFTGTPNAIVTYTVNGGGSQTITLDAAGTATVTNTYTANTTFTLVSVATAGAPVCSQLQAGSAIISIVPLPTATIAANTTICSGGSATITFTGTPNATITYTVNGGGNQNIVLSGAGVATLTNTFTTTAIYTLVSAASAGVPSCSQPLTGGITITVLPLPTVAMGSNTNICPGGSATVTFTGTPNATVTYNINGAGNLTIPLNAAGTATIINTYSATTVFNLVSITSADPQSCTQPQTGSITITVTPLPTVTISGSASICPGGSATVTFTGTPNAIVTYTVNGSGNQNITLNAAGTATLTNTYTANTTFTLVNVTSAGSPGCTNPQTGTAIINIVPLPTVTIAADATICIGSSIPVTFIGTPNAMVTYNVNGGGNQTITLNGSGTAVITSVYNVTTIYNLVSVATTGTPSCSQPQTGSVTITVVPLPTVAMTSSTTICSGDSAIITFTGTPNAMVTYNIDGDGNLTIPLNAAGTATITNTYTATTVYNLVSIRTAGTPGCSVPQTGTVTITVAPLPTVTISSSTTICSGANAVVTFTGTPNSQVTYTVDGGGNTTILLNAAGTATISNTYTATTVYNLVGVASTTSPNCSRPITGTVTITVVPLPTVTLSSSITICSGGSATVTFTGTPNATASYSINGGGNQSILLNAAGIATLTSSYTATAIFNLISVSTSGTPGCSQPQTGTITITVLPLPIVTVASSASTICSGGSATVTFTGTPNASINYTVNGGSNQTIVLDASGTATLSNTYTTTTTFALVSAATTGTPGCSQPQTGSITINVIPLPTVTISANTAICTGGNATVTFTGTPNAIVTYTINAGAEQTITLNASGITTVTNSYTADTTFNLVSVATTGTPSCGQPQTGTMVITVLPLPTAIIAADALICSGSSATITFTGTPNATVAYTVNGGGNQIIVLDATGNATLTNIYTATTVYALVNIATAGTPSCVVPVTGTATITVIPLPVVTIAANTTICSGDPATITFTGTPNAIITYTVNSGGNQTLTLDASGTAMITNNYTVSTTFTLVEATLNGTISCSQPQTGSATITVEPIPTVTISGGATICSGLTSIVTFTGTPNATVNYTANGDNETIVLNNSGTATINVAYTATTVYNLVSITTAGTPGCTNPQSGTITITVLPLPTVTITSNSSICMGSPNTVIFTGTPNATVTYTVNGGNNQVLVLDAAGTASVIATFTVATTYTLVSVSDASNCSRSLSQSLTIAVNPLPTVTFAITSATTVCAGSNATVTFTGTPNSIVTYTVNGDVRTINIGTSGIAVLNAAYTATSVLNLVSITLSDPPSCSQAQTGTLTINVVQPPAAGSNAVLPLCGNSAPQNLFLLLGSTAQTGGTWSPALASGTGIFNPAVDIAGTYTYTVVGTPPCVNDTASATVTVVPQTNAGNDGIANLCSNADPINLFTFLGGTPQTGGTWSPALPSGTGMFNPGSDTEGIYTYTVIGVAPCVNDVATVTVNITPGPDAGISGSLALCVNSPAQDLFLSLGGIPQVGGTWSPALTSGTGVFNPAVDLPGVYTYTFSGNQPCDDDTATVIVTVNPVPDAGQDGTAVFCSNYAPSDLFANLGGTPQLGGTWSPALASGTGFFNPLVDVAGTYTYTVGGGLCSTDISQVVVTVFQSPNAGGLNATLLINTCVTSNSVDLFAALNGTQGIGVWSDDDATGALANNIFNPTIPGAGTYHFTYTVSGGISPCLTDTAMVTVVVSPIPNAGTFTGIQSFCTSTGTLDLFTLITGNQTGGIWDVNTVEVVNPLDISAFAPGTYSYTYTVTNSCGSDLETVQFIILPNPVLNLPDITVASPICKGENAVVTFANMADGDYTLTFNLSVSNVLTDVSTAVTIAGGTGTLTINAADIPNVGITTITFLNIASASTSCSTVVADVSANFIIKPNSNLENANLSIANLCQGNAATVRISNAVDLPNGNYQFNYTVPQAIPTGGTTGTVVITAGAGEFTIPAAQLPTAGNYTLTISTITSLSSGCDNLNETATAVFEVFATPDTNGATVSAGPVCVNFPNDVSITGATALADGNYTIAYQLTGSNTAASTVGVNFVNGTGTFAIPASDLDNAGNVTLTISGITSDANQCGTGGTNFTAITFAVSQLATPVLEPQGEEFCMTDKPAISDLSESITTQGGETVVWYDAAQGGTSYSNSDLLVNNQTYYAALSNGSGCESATRLPVTVDLTKCLDIVIPDGFSPNNDGTNDTFEIKNLALIYPNFKLEIYNRYGNILYKGNSNTPNWDGTTSQGGMKLGDSLLPVGVYFYILEYNDGIKKPKQGRVYLSR